MKGQTGSVTPTLDQYSRDLTQMAEERKIRSCYRKRKRDFENYSGFKP